MTDYRNVTTVIEWAAVLPQSGGYRDLKVTDATLSADMDRVPFTLVTMRIAPVDADTWTALNPTKSEAPTYVHFRAIQHVAGDPAAVIARLPAGSVGPTPTARMVLRRVTRNRLTGEITLTLAGNETLMDDKKRIATTATNTGATTVADLVYWSLLDVFGTYAMNGIPPSNAIPAGDRRFMFPGDSHSDLIEGELDAIGYRLWDYWGDSWSVTERDNPPRNPDLPSIRSYASYPGVPLADPIITNIEGARERDIEEWADAVMIKGSYVDSAGTRREWTQIPDGGGVNTKGRVITLNRPPIPGLANLYTLRAKMRGAAYVVTARIDLALTPGQRIIIHTPAEVIGSTTRKITVRSVEFNLEAGSMTFTAHDEGLVIG